MLTLNIKLNDEAKVLNLPTSINELTPDFLNGVTNDVQVADNYSLIGLVFVNTVARVLMIDDKNTKDATAKVTPIFIKAGATDNNYINKLKAGDNIVIASSDISMGFHINAKHNPIALNKVISLFHGAANKYNYQTNITKNIEVCFIEFKLVPNVAIHGAYVANNDNTVEIPFGVKDVTTEATSN